MSFRLTLNVIFKFTKTTYLAIYFTPYFWHNINKPQGRVSLDIQVIDNNYYSINTFSTRIGQILRNHRVQFKCSCRSPHHNLLRVRGNQVMRVIKKPMLTVRCQKLSIAEWKSLASCNVTVRLRRSAGVDRLENGTSPQSQLNQRRRLKTSTTSTTNSKLVFSQYPSMRQSDVDRFGVRFL